MTTEEVMIFAGTASSTLAQRICDYLGTSLRRSEAFKFSDGNTFVRVLENVRGRDVFIVQSLAHATNDQFMELLFFVDAFKRASASSVTAIIPYFGYGKGDKKDEPRVSIRARVCADSLEAAGASRIVTLDLHAPQIQGFFRIPVDNLYGYPTLCAELRSEIDGTAVVVAGDAGFAAEARMFADHLHCSIAIADKKRSGHDEQAEVVTIVGEVSNRTAVLVDDFIVSGGSLAAVSRILRDRGAKRIVFAATHGIFSAGAARQIDECPVEKVLVTDTVETHVEPLSPKVRVVSAAPVLGEAIRRIHTRESISAMFPDGGR
jgi:ribose-phosphate pyrophosphokinase